MNTTRKHFVVATSTRADWGLLSPLATELRRRGASVTVAATNMHLLEECGMTVSEIEADGFMPVRLPADGTACHIAAEVLDGFGKLLDADTHTAVIILGDRYEMLAAATAAAIAGVPVVHIAGGATSEGAFDEFFRHAITKLAVLHLTETELYRQRIITMGENPARVVTTGAIGIHNILNTTLMSRSELEESVGFGIPPDTLLVTMHAATLSKLSPQNQLANLLDALDRFGNNHIIFTHPNNDVNPAPLIEMLYRYRDRHPDRVHIVPSLGRLRYLSALKYVAAVVGNSSSGIVEVPSMGIPTLDIGCRQEGRLHGLSVVRCAEDTGSIADGIALVLSDSMKRMAALRDNPYARPDTLQLMADSIMNTTFVPFQRKHFYDH